MALKARNLEETERFYTKVLGLEVVNRFSQPRGVSFTLGEQHHNLVVFEVSPQAYVPKEDQVGLHHVAIQVEDFTALKACYRTLKQHDVPILREVRYERTQPGA